MDARTTVMRHWARDIAPPPGERGMMGKDLAGYCLGRGWRDVRGTALAAMLLCAAIACAPQSARDEISSMPAGNGASSSSFCVLAVDGECIQRCPGERPQELPPRAVELAVALLVMTDVLQPGFSFADVLEVYTGNLSADQLRAVRTVLRDGALSRIREATYQEQHIADALEELTRPTPKRFRVAVLAVPREDAPRDSDAALASARRGVSRAHTRAVATSAAESAGA